MRYLEGLLDLFFDSSIGVLYWHVDGGAIFEGDHNNRAFWKLAPGFLKAEVFPVSVSDARVFSFGQVF